MEEFEPSSDAWNREWRSLSKVRGLESDMQDFKQRSRLGSGNVGVRVKFRRFESGMEEFEQSSRHGIGNGGVRAKLRRLESVWRSSKKVRSLELEMEEFE